MKDHSATFVWKYDSFGRKERARARRKAEAIALQKDMESVRKPVVIMVDDDPSMREAIAAVLGKRYEVVSLSDGDELLSMIESYQPDVVMLDVNLPGKDGFALCRSLRSTPRFRHVPVMFLTVLRDDESFTRSLQSNADAYMSKPFEPKELVETIDRLISPPMCRAA